MTDLNLREIYTRAADWLEAHEWIRDENFLSPKGVKYTRLDNALDPNIAGACAEGAIRICGGDTQATAFFEQTLGKPLFVWNDTPGRTKAEVIAKLREAAAAQPGAPS